LFSAHAGKPPAAAGAACGADWLKRNGGDNAGAVACACQRAIAHAAARLLDRRAAFPHGGLGTAQQRRARRPPADLACAQRWTTTRFYTINLGDAAGINTSCISTGEATQDALRAVVSRRAGMPPSGDMPEHY